MHLKSVLALATTLFGICATTVLAAPPVNDKIEDAAVLGINQTIVEGNVHDATALPFEIVHGVKFPRTVWYRINNLPAGSYFLQLDSAFKGAFDIWLDPQDPQNPGEFIHLGNDSSISVANEAKVISGAVFKMPAISKPVYIQVGADSSSQDKFNLYFYSLGSTNKNNLVITPPSIGRLGTGAFNGSFKFSTKKIYAVNLADTPVTLTRQTTLPSNGIDQGSFPQVVPPASAILLPLSATGNGPHFGEVGQWRGQTDYIATRNGVKVGTGTIMTNIVRFGQKLPGNPPVLEMRANGGAAKMGGISKAAFMIYNKSTSPMTGCTLWDFMKLAQGLDEPALPTDLQFQRIDPVSGNAIGGANSPFDMGPNKAAKFIVTMNHFSPVGRGIVAPIPLCAEQPGEGSVQFGNITVGESTFVSETYVKGPASASVLFPGLAAPRMIKITKGGQKLVPVTIVNKGPERALSVFGSSDFLGKPVNLPVIYKICEDKAGACAKPAVTSLTTTFKAGEARKFLLVMKSTGTAIAANPGSTRSYVYTYDDGNYVGMAGFAIATQ